MADTHFDAVVVGSGFGGSVTAYRLAEKGKRVCLLERGKPYPPNSFARSPFKMKNNFWDPSKNLYGMFNVWSFKGLAALISSGLGGGSLIYANVLLRKDEKWFVKEDINKGGYEYWPVTRADLDPHYSQVERMMNVQKLPYYHQDYKLPKTRAMEEAAKNIKDVSWDLVPLAVTFYNKGEEPVAGQRAKMGEPIKEEHGNLHGQTRYTCRCCGECDVGCNYGSKNTLDYNYLSEAKRLGAEIRTLCEVKSFAPRQGGGYTVTYLKHEPDPKLEGQAVAPKPAEVTITCDRLILAAGTFGSTFLLLKNKDNFPKISRKLGTRFCGNGDLLTFALKSCEANGGKKVPRVLDGSFGPVITSAIRMPDALDDGGASGGNPVGKRGFYLEDAGYPDFFNWMMQVFEAENPTSLGRYWKAAVEYMTTFFGKHSERNVGDIVSELFGSCALSSSSLPMLGMGRDLPNGKMFLRDGKYLDVDWSFNESKPYFDRLRSTMKSVADNLHADFVDNPMWYLRRVITVHPLGGCPMGRDENEGVVNSYGEVFNYPGLYVACGAMMPGPVGANPSLTIAALANRFADRMLNQ